MTPINRYLWYLCGAYRTDERGAYYPPCEYAYVGVKGVHIVLAGDGVITSQGPTAPPILCSRAPDGLEGDELEAWCAAEVDRLIQVIIDEAKESAAS